MRQDYGQVIGEGSACVLDALTRMRLVDGEQVALGWQRGFASQRVGGTSRARSCTESAQTFELLLNQGS